MATNASVRCVSKDRFVRYFVEVPKLAQAPLGYGLQPEYDCVAGPRRICQRALVLLPQSRAGNFRDTRRRICAPHKG